jgi:outer membrane protein assembly factor BamE
MIHHIARDRTMPAKHRNRLILIQRSGLTTLACLAALALAGCGSFKTDGINPVNWITPYKVDVIQGNFVSKEQVESLKVGMTRAQVKDILGTPLLTSLFHADRWDYVFTLKRQGVEPKSFKYAVFFKGDQLERFEGDAMPTNDEFVASLANNREIGKVPVLQATEEQLKAAEKSSNTAAATSGSSPTVAPAGTPPASYPPLERAKP